MTNKIQKSKPNYGFDGSPFGISILFVVGIVCLVSGIVIVNFNSIGLKVLAVILILFGCLVVAICCSYLYYIKFGKFQRRDKILSMVHWNGFEHVLDIGTGRGLLMIGAAKRLTSGISVGIDIWNSADMHDNSIKNTNLNAELEGVLKKVEVRNEDARSMSFPDETFEVVLSNLCMHNIPTKDEREKACQEIVRVLKKNGSVIIADKAHTKEYGDFFAKAGLTVELYRPFFDGSIRAIVKATKK